MRVLRQKGSKMNKRTYGNMTDAELNAEGSKRRGWTDVQIVPFDPNEIMLATGIPPAQGCRIICSEVADDLNEAVKLPGFDTLEWRGDEYEARILDTTKPTHRFYKSHSSSLAICLAFLANYEAKHGEGE